MSTRTQLWLSVYASVLTTVVSAALLAGWLTKRISPAQEITVQRINVVEPDGRIRMVISNRARFPGSYYQGQEISRADRDSTGVLFMNDEGTEMGGLIFGGARDKNGEITANGHLSFDQYDQDQTFALDAGQFGPSKRTMLVISDRGDYPLHEAYGEIARIRALPPNERRTAMQAFRKAHPGDQPRLQLGRTTDRSAVLRMEDESGRDRIVMKVEANGTPTLQFLDENGVTVDQLPRQSQKEHR